MLIKQARSERSCQKRFPLTERTQPSPRRGVSSSQTSRKELFISFFLPLFPHPDSMNSERSYPDASQTPGVKVCPARIMNFFFCLPSLRTSQRGSARVLWVQISGFRALRTLARSSGGGREEEGRERRRRRMRGGTGPRVYFFLAEARSAPARFLSADIIYLVKGVPRCCLKGREKGGGRFVLGGPWCNLSSSWVLFCNLRRLLLVSP